MRPPIDDGTIVITGASSGIGLELAKQLAPRAKAIGLVARREDRLEKLASELRAARPSLDVRVYACDLADRDATDRFIEAVERDLGAVDVLVNNAGMGDFGLFELASWEKTERMIEINVMALTRLTRRWIQPMIERGRGGILNVSSGFGMAWLPGFAAYVGTKHFVTGFSECLRAEARARGVVVSQLCPGPVSTEFEEVAGVRSGTAPAMVTLTAEQCARSAIRGFSRGKAIIIPGFWIKIAMALGAVSPRWLQRLVYRPFATNVRRFSERRAAKALPPA
jgi:hypothetical protein